MTVPKSFRAYLGIPKGGSVEFALSDDGTVILRPRHATAHPLRGILSAYAPQTPVSIDEINRGIGEAIAEELRKGARSD